MVLAKLLPVISLLPFLHEADSKAGGALNGLNSFNGIWLGDACVRRAFNC